MESGRGGLEKQEDVRLSCFIGEAVSHCAPADDHAEISLERAMTMRIIATCGGNDIFILLFLECGVEGKEVDGDPLRPRKQPNGRAGTDRQTEPQPATAEPQSPTSK